jgi:hypothetical protein
MCFAKSSGVPPAAFAPCFESFSFASGVASHFAISALSFATMAAGVPAGARTPNHDYASYPGSPASAIVGTSGSAGARARDVTASARSLPALICGSDGGRLSNISCT